MNKKNNYSEHEFAFYYPQTTSAIIPIANAQKKYPLEDKTLCHRITSIVRLEKGESFILFDATNNVKCTIETTDKKILISCTAVQKNKVLEPRITFLLPILKREAFEEAVYSLTEIGVNEIQPIITAKMQRQIQFDKEKERISRVIQAAAEQSKNFAFPTIKNPLLFDKISEIIYAQTSFLLFFDPEGKPLQELVSPSKKYEHFTLMIGPEGDLTAEEKAKLKELNFVFCALTPTILRAQQAAAVSAGIIRSLF